MTNEQKNKISLEGIVDMVKVMIALGLTKTAIMSVLNKHTDKTNSTDKIYQIAEMTL